MGRQEGKFLAEGPTSSSLHPSLDWELKPPLEGAEPAPSLCLPGWMPQASGRQRNVVWLVALATKAC